MIVTEPDWKGVRSSGYGRVHTGDTFSAKRLIIFH